MKNEKRSLLTLFLTFLKIGAFTFGGGYAMIPLIQKDISEKRGWITDKEILDIIAIAESTPGPIAVNTATFVGYKIRGFWGSLLCTLGVVIPSFLIITLIAFVLKEFQELKVVQYAFFGIRAGILALIIKAFYTMYKACPKNMISYIIAIFSFIAVALIGINVFTVLILCGITGVVYLLFTARRLDK